MRFGGGMGGSGPMFGPDDFQQRMQQMQSRFFDMQSQFQDMQRVVEESKNNAIRQSLGVTDQQWTRIKPRLDRIERLKTEVNAAIEPGSSGGGSSFVSGDGSFGGGWSGGFTTFGSGGPGQNWSRTETFGPGGSRTTRSGTAEPSPSQNLCEELYNLTYDPSEQTNLFGYHEAAYSDLRLALEFHLDESQRLNSGRTESGNQLDSMTKEQLDRLRALGYIQAP